MPKIIKRILVIRTGRIGDTVFATAILNALPAAYGDSLSIDWLTSPVVAPLFEHDTRINQVFTIKSRRAPLLINSAKLRLICHSWLKPYDVIINLETATFFNRMICLMRAHAVIGLPHDLPPPNDFSQHAVDSQFGIARRLPQLAIETSRAPKLYGKSFDAVKADYQLADKYIVLSPANSHHEDKTQRNFRAWPEAHWVALLNYFAKHDIAIYLVGTPLLTNWLNQLIEKSNHQNVRYLANTGLSELITILQHAITTVTADTGTLHIAAASGEHVTALFGPSPETQTGPYTKRAKQALILRAKKSCAPCKGTPLEKTCPFNACMQELSPRYVYQAICSAHPKHLGGSHE